jgi:hypothetical protein
MIIPSIRSETRGDNMSLFGKIFGTKDVIKKAADGIYNGVDASFFTEEEKAEYRLNLLKAYEPFKLIQRVLATLVTSVYLGVWVLSAILYVISIFFDPCTVEVVCKYVQLQEVSKDLAMMNNTTLGNPFLAIMGLYFAGGMLEGALRSKK